MDVLIKIMTWLGDAYFAATAFASPEINLWIISALMGFVMLWIWRFTSNQAAIADVRRKISAHLLATRLFKDDLSVTFRAQRQIILQALRLLLHSLRPMVIMLAPFILVMTQIGLRYEHRAAPIGRVTRVKATMKTGHAVESLGTALQLPDGLERDANDPCCVKSLRTVDWRITPGRAGIYALTFGAGADALQVPLVVGDGFERVSRLVGGHWSDRLLYSAEPSIPSASPYESIEVYYPARTTPLLGWDMHWLISLLILSIAFALLFKPFVKVHI